MNRILVGTLSLVLALPAWALAQGSGSSASTGIPSGGVSAGTADNPAFAVTRTLTAKITSIDVAKNIIVVEDSKGKKYAFKIEKDTKLKADKKTEFGHKKNLALADFEAGQPVRITVLASNGMAIEVRLVKEKS
jgi:hypothetical protein